MLYTIPNASSAERRAFLRALSRLIGWIYFALWSLSFYPQPILNYRQASTAGFAIDFPLCNLFGMTYYLISNSFLLFSPFIRQQYADRHHNQLPTTQLNDWVYSAHALLLILVGFSQFVPWLWGFEKRRGQMTEAECGDALGSRGGLHQGEPEREGTDPQTALRIASTQQGEPRLLSPDSKRARPSTTIVSILGGTLVIILVSVILVPLSSTAVHQATTSTWTYLDVINTMGSLKVVLTAIKYMPQVLLNYRRKSTKGWSTGAVIMDLVGGALSLLQLVIDSGLEDDWSGIVGSPAKFGLANVSIAFDVIFLWQRYVAYPRSSGYEVGDRRVTEGDNTSAVEGERRPLLRNASTA